MFRYLIFDLDDTLLDTYGILIPDAINKACQSMIDAGLSADLKLCVQAWKQLHLQYSEINLYLKIIEVALQSPKSPSHFSEEQKNKIAEAGFKSFLTPQLPEQLKAEPEVVAILERLSKKYTLFLLTQGNPKTQKEKIKKMNIEKYFHEIFIVNSERNENKKHILEKLLQTVNSDASLYLSVGNRLRHEIAMAKSVGMHTCHVKQGEHANELAQNSFEKADWTISKLTELERVCKL